jgi:hypothetical protein
MADRLLPDEADGYRNGRSAVPSATVLVVGGADAATQAQAALMGGTTVAVPFGALDAALLARLCPEWVVFPLMTTGADAPLVIETLVALGYAGRACVVAPQLPNRRMVEVELRSIAPTLHLVLVEAAD